MFALITHSIIQSLIWELVDPQRHDPRVTGQKTRRTLRSGSSAAGRSVDEPGEADELDGELSL